MLIHQWACATVTITISASEKPQSSRVPLCSFLQLDIAVFQWLITQVNSSASSMSENMTVKSFMQDLGDTYAVAHFLGISVLETNAQALADLSSTIGLNCSQCNLHWTNCYVLIGLFSLLGGFSGLPKSSLVPGAREKKKSTWYTLLRMRLISPRCGHFEIFSDSSGLCDVRVWTQYSILVRIL